MLEEASGRGKGVMSDGAGSEKEFQSCAGRSVRQAMLLAATDS